jgi:hypothetical protein
LSTQRSSFYIPSSPDDQCLRHLLLLQLAMFYFYIPHLVVLHCQRATLTRTHFHYSSSVSTTFLSSYAQRATRTPSGHLRTPTGT